MERDWIEDGHVRDEPRALYDGQSLLRVTCHRVSRKRIRLARAHDHVRSPRFDVLGCLHFIAWTRVHLTMTWVVSSSIFERPRRSAQVAHLPHQHLCLVGLCLSFGGFGGEDGDVRGFITHECRDAVYDLRLHAKSTVSDAL